MSIESESEVVQSCPTLCDPMDCSLPVTSVAGIFQARVLEWVAISFSRGSSQARDRTWVSRIVGSLSHQGSPQLEKSFLAQIWRRRNYLLVRSPLRVSSSEKWDQLSKHGQSQVSLIYSLTLSFFFFSFLRLENNHILLVKISPGAGIQQNFILIR